MDNSCEDLLNEETFGSSTASRLPSFLQNPGTTVLDELAGLTITRHDVDDEDEYSNDDTFGEHEVYTGQEKLPDFFKTTSSSAECSITDALEYSSNSSRPPLPAGATVMNERMEAQPSFTPPAPPQISQSMVYPPEPLRQVMQCPPGQVPPPQSLASLSTPGMGTAWHAGYVPRGMHPRGHHAPPPHMQQQYPPPGMIGRGGAGGQPYNSGQAGRGGGQGSGRQRYQQQHPPRGPPAGPVQPRNAPGTPVDPAGRTPDVNRRVPIAPGLSPGGGRGSSGYQRRGEGSGNYPRLVPSPHAHVQMQAPRPFASALPHGEMMTPSDVRFVVSKVLQLTETQDPYTDDFYFIQRSLKKHGDKMMQAVEQNRPPPPPLPMPLPTWTTTQERVRRQMEETRQHFEDRSRKWEQEAGVLGHNVKTDVTKPRAVLNLSAPSRKAQSHPRDEGDGGNKEGEEEVEDSSDEGDDEVTYDANGNPVTPFNTVLWSMRRAVHRGFCALNTAQELHQLLMTPMVASNPTIREEILQEARDALALLSKCLGVKIAEPAVPIARGLGDPSAPVTYQPATLILDGSLVAAVLQTAKGKKLMNRALALLSQDHRWTLLPVIVARVLQKDPKDQTTEDMAVEANLLNNLMMFIQHEHDTISQRQAIPKPPPGMVPPGADDSRELYALLGYLRQCVKSVMVSQMEKSQLRNALKSSRKRAEVMNVILRLGDKVVECSDDPSRSADWSQLRDAFMLMLET